MASFAYISQLLFYDNDDGSQSLRHQKLRIDPATADPIVPVTPLITVRVVNTSNQYEGTNINLRHLNVSKSDLEIAVVIPYGSTDVANSNACIREILNSPGVVAGRYVGESENNGDTANHNF